MKATVSVQSQLDAAAGERWRLRVHTRNISQVLLQCFLGFLPFLPDTFHNMGRGSIRVRYETESIDCIGSQPFIDFELCKRSGRRLDNLSNVSAYPYNRTGRSSCLRP